MVSDEPVTDDTVRNSGCAGRLLRAEGCPAAWCGGFWGVGEAWWVDLCGALVACIVIRVAAADAERLRPTPF
jgi:hypothetical protein